MRTRIHPDSNYKAIYIDGKTMRLPIDRKKPVTALKFPEFYDVKITNRCYGGCSYCYQSSTGRDYDFQDIPKKINDFFGPMSLNERPFQVAIGGGEPTIHPEFRAICKAFDDLGIDPNYTTNGTHLTDEILDVTEQYVTGVAVSCHAHLPWEDGVRKLIDRGIYTNLHIVISNHASVKTFKEIYNKYHGHIQHFVLLPMVAQGRATDEFRCWPMLKEYLNSLTDRSDIAFGALFHPYLSDLDWDISIYEPEAFSKYMVMDDMSLHPSSFQVIS
jgi:sulfatase maturation enzyme AslB (radical SAM superfamily)